MTTFTLRVDNLVHTANDFKLILERVTRADAQPPNNYVATREIVKTIAFFRTDERAAAENTMAFLNACAPIVCPGD